MFSKNKISPHTKQSDQVIRHYLFMLVLLWICGYSFDFFTTRFLIKCLMKTYAILLIALVTVATLTCCDFQEISQIWSLMEYVSSVLIILFFKCNIRSFFQRIGRIDSFLRINRKHYSELKVKLFASLFFVWFLRIIYTWAFCSYNQCYNDLSLFLISQFSLLALDLNRVWRFNLFDVIRYRLKMLRLRLEEFPESNFYLYMNDNKGVKENKIRFCLHLYRSIADVIELISPELFASMFMSIVCSLPKLIINAYHIMLVIESHVHYTALCFIIIHLFQICVFLFSPCVVAELYAKEVDSMRLFLIHKLIDEQDPKIKQEIEVFLRYTEVRNFQYKIWRIIPLNIALPLEVINLCTTYVIVIINFTHLY